MNIRFPCFLTIALLLALPATAETNKPAPAKHATADSPKSIGKFDDWTAATHKEAGQTVCYAFTRAQSSAPLVAWPRGCGADRDRALVGSRCHRDRGGASPMRRNATVTVQVDQTGLDFYTSGQNAFARDGKAAVTAFGKGTRAIARSPSPKEVTDTFSLKGFAPGLCGDRQGMSREVSDLSEADRARVLAKSALFDPPDGVAGRRAARSGRDGSRRIGGRDGGDRRTSVPRQAAVALDLPPGRHRFRSHVLDRQAAAADWLSAS